MKIIIVNTFDNAFVEVTSKYGKIIGKWMNENIPNNKEQYDVEIDYNKILHFEIMNEPKYDIRNDNGKNIICGFVIDESTDDNFVQYLDFGGDAEIKKNDISSDSTIMIDIEKRLKDTFIKLEVDEIEFYPVFY